MNVAERLAQPIPETLPKGPVGLSTRAHAERMMMAPAVLAGDAIYVGLPYDGDMAAERFLSEEVAWHGGSWLLARGAMAVTHPLPRRPLIEWLRGRIERLAPFIDAEDVATMVEVLDGFETL